MKLHEHLDDVTKQKLNYTTQNNTNIVKRKTHNRRNKRKQERLSERDIKELMGINRDTYTRRNGAIRRK